MSPESAKHLSMLKLIGTDGRRYYAWSLEPGQYVIGRMPECDMLVSDRTVSRRHAQLDVVSPSGPFYLLDLGSHNGTLVNGQRIASRVELRESDRVMFGAVGFKLQATETVSSVSPPKITTSELAAGEISEKSVFLSIDQALKPLPSNVTERPEVLPTLFDMAKELVMPEPKEVMLERSLTLVARAIPAQRLAVLLTPEGSADPYVAAYYVPDPHETGSFTLSRTIINEILTNKTAILIGNSQDDPRYAAQQSVIMSPFKSAMAVPLFAEGEVLGILYADSMNPSHRYNDDYLRLFATFGNLLAFRLLNYALLTERQERQVIDAELRRASLIQRNLLTKTPPQIPGYKIHAFQEQCRTVGGDLYDLAHLTDGRLLFLVADVSGKGLGAALLMSNVLASFRIMYDNHQFDVCQAVKQASRQLFEHSAPEDFATLFLGVIDPVNDRLTYCNAGHNPPWLMREDGSIENLEASGLMIGAFDFTGWVEQKVELKAGDLLFVYTDGITEAEGEAGLYGEERARQALVGLKDRSLEEIANGVLQDVTIFAGNHPRSDDVTMLLIMKERTC
ncbi:MAG TPA: SpoIIE family protein phosphatase [Candidatus Deferrimicrobium sp.]|nr:SpoIIE family protein phosphatase [Candidatus Deferrimicrobium sp.]